MNPIQLHSDETTAALASQLGYACELLYSCSRKCFPLSALDYWVSPAILLKQIKFFFDHRGRPVAYLTWAFLSDEVSARMERDVINVLHLSEWNEGLNLWVLDFVAPYGHTRSVCRYIRDEMFEFAAELKGIKRNQCEEMMRIRRFNLRAYRRTRRSPR